MVKKSSIEYLKQKTSHRPRSLKLFYKRALYYAAAEAYHAEVVQPLMMEFIIGEGKDYASKEEWIESKVQEWLEAVQ